VSNGYPHQHSFHKIGDLDRGRLQDMWGWAAVRMPIFVNNSDHPRAEPSHAQGSKGEAKLPVENLSQATVPNQRTGPAPEEAGV